MAYSNECSTGVMNPSVGYLKCLALLAIFWMAWASVPTARDAADALVVV